TKTGAGKLTLSGNNTYTGGTDVDAGWLILNGTSAGIFGVNSGAGFGGSGTVGNLNNGGTVAPGNSIGTINVTGDYVHDPSATYEVEINDSGQSDLIDVTGAATINGGTVDVQPEAGTYTWGMQYTILEGDGGVTGTFDTVTGSIEDVRLSLIYNPFDIQLLLMPLYVTVAQTPNQNAVATVLDQMAVSPTGDVAVVLGQLDSVICNPGSAVCFDQMGGEVFGTTASVGVEHTTRFLGTVGSRLRTMTGFQAAGGSGSARSFASNTFDSLDGALVRGQSPSWLAQASSCWRPWAQGYGVSGNAHGDGNASGFNYGVGGTTVAIDRALDGCTRLGLVGGYSNSQIYLSSPAQRAYVDSGQFAVYLQRRSCCRYLTGIFSYAHNSYDTSRQLAFGSLARTASANYGGNEFAFYLEGGHTFQWGSLQLQPYGALQYIGLHQPAFSETGAGSMNLAVDAMQTDSFRGLLGSRMVWYKRSVPGRVVAPELRALWRHEFLDEGRLVGADFIGTPGSSFVVAGADLGRDAAVLGGGCTVYFGDQLNIFAGYDLLVNNTQVAHAGTGGFQFLW
ncbi:MAG: autotransporter domain-containing protein, partial [Planctomycetes bacterium]|nr:autotransporter domain-containing protein [Planctomycetota bacterium]